MPTVPYPAYPMGIYTIRNTVTGECYIGRAVNIRRRMLAHHNALLGGQHQNRRLQSAWTTHGAQSFTFALLDYVEDKNELMVAECQWLTVLRPAYNVCLRSGTSARVDLGPRASSLRLADVQDLEATLARFWAHVDTTAGPTGCWLWTGARRNWNYGILSIRVAGRASRWLVIHAARFSYLLVHGSLPERYFVCHNCPGGDNPACVNPAHLWLGTSAENNRDRARKGRSALGDRSGSRRYPESRRHGDQCPPERRPRGAAVAGSKLTETDVRAIRARFAGGTVSKGALAREYGVTRGNIRQIICRETWAHLDN